MQLPFSIDQFLDDFRLYNEMVWPAQWVLVGVAVLILFATLAPTARAGRMVSALLAILWLWMGAVYHLMFFRLINPAATLFGALAVVQAVLLAYYGVARGRLVFSSTGDVTSALGGMLIVYALVLYPVLAIAFDHAYPATATFGLPCPTTIFTLGLLVWARPPLPRAVAVIPLLWALVGSTAVLQLGMWEDLGLLVAALLAAPVLLIRGRHVGMLRPV